MRDIYKQFVKDQEWFQLHIVVRANQVQVRLNDMLLVDYVQPDPAITPAHFEGRGSTTEPSRCNAITTVRERSSEM